MRSIRRMASWLSALYRLLMPVVPAKGRPEPWPRYLTQQELDERRRKAAAYEF